MPSKVKTIVDAPRGNVYFMDPDDITIIGLDTKDTKEHPLWDKRIELPINEQLVDSIMTSGFFGAIVVRKNGDAVEVEAGRQRVRAARVAKQKLLAAGKEFPRVTVSFRKDSDEAAYRIGVAENQFRVNDGPLMLADKIKDYLDRVGDTAETRRECGKLYGFSGQQVGQYMKLHELAPKVLKAIAEGLISATAASEFSDMKRAEQEEALASALAGGRTSRAAIRSQKKAKNKSNGKGSGDADGEGEGEHRTKRFITKVLMLNDEKDLLNRDFVKGIMWALGDLSSKRVPHMRELEKEVRGE
jgi:ParB family chromosome partitioning protein